MVFDVILELMPSSNKVQILKYKFQNYYSWGFSFIELMVVISIGAIISIVGVASYTNFATSTVLKNAALQLKSDLRLTQNKVVAGDKRVNDNASLRCPKVEPSGKPLYTLVGWYLTLTKSSNTYTINSTCRDADNPSAPDQADIPVFKTIKLPQGVSISDIDGSVAAVQVLFQPLVVGATFHGVSTPPFYVSGTLQPEVVYTAPYKITLSDGTGSYQLFIEPSGEISEKKL